MPTNNGKDFEEAVYRFVQALGSQAQVKFDHKVPDRDTGTLRQCDAWVEGRFLGHFPLKYLISCKDKGRKLNIEDVSAFAGQISSVKASSGALYSRNGFTRSAVAKAKGLGIACCRLYDDQPADIPGLLFFRAFTTKVRIWLDAKRVHALNRELRTWGDLFALNATGRDSGVKETILDSLAAAYRDGEEQCLAERQLQGLMFPQNFARIVGFPVSGAAIILQVQWKKYRGNVDAHLMNGSYSYTDGHFRGHQFSPSIDTWAASPGPGWEALADDVQILATEGPVLLSLFGHNIAEQLRHGFSEQLLPETAF